MSNTASLIQGLVLEKIKGGPGSGFYGHAGRPGKWGGSAPAGGQAGMDTANSRPMSYFLIPPTGNKRVVDVVNNAIAALDQVHGIDTLTRRIPIKINSTTVASAQIVRNRSTGQILQINVSRVGNLNESDVMHEVGHAIYFTHFVDRAGKITDEVKPILKAIVDSQAYKNVSSAPNVIHNKYRNRLGQEVDQAIETIDHKMYLKSNAETFARAYAQWVATKSKNKSALKLIKSYAFSEPYTLIMGEKTTEWRLQSQWAPDDFKPIAKEFDKLFKARGWIN
jgi:hypothetical protein